MDNDTGNSQLFSILARALVLAVFLCLAVVGSTADAMHLAGKLASIAILAGGLGWLLLVDLRGLGRASATEENSAAR